MVRSIAAFIPGVVRRMLALAALLAGGGAAFAHPHVFVTTRAEIVADASGRITAIRHVWTFDEAYSAFLGQGLDKNGDGKLSREELAELAKVNVDSLADTAFFTVAKFGGRAAEFGPPANYFLESDGKTLTLHFDLPLAKPTAAGVAFFLEVYDPSFFVSFALAEEENAARLTGAPAGCKLAIRRPAKAAATALSKLSEQIFQNQLGDVGDMALQASAKIHVACP